MLLASACKFIKEETLTQVFFCHFCWNFKKTIFIEHLRATAYQRRDTYSIERT